MFTYNFFQQEAFGIYSAKALKDFLDRGKGREYFGETANYGNKNFGETAILALENFGERGNVVSYQILLSDKLSANLGYVYGNLIAQMLVASGNNIYLQDPYLA